MHLFGHSKQFRRALERNWDKLFRIAYTWSHDQQTSYDLVQETMVRALHHREKITDDHALEIWLCKVMANCWRDLFRRHKDFTDINENTLETESRPDHELERARIVSKVQLAIAGLSFDQRQVITLVALQGYSYEEVAEILAIPAGTVMSRVCRARQKLKQLLHDLATNTDIRQRIRRIK
jgi:RNA polymerase sigma-70 factor (ECF subfamily)